MFETCVTFLKKIKKASFFLPPVVQPTNAVSRADNYDAFLQVVRRLDEADALLDELHSVLGIERTPAPAHRARVEAGRGPAMAGTRTVIVAVLSHAALAAAFFAGVVLITLVLTLLGS